MSVDEQEALCSGVGIGIIPVSSAALAKALCGAGLMAWLQDDFGEARSQLEESVALWRRLGDERGLAQSLRVFSHACWAARTLR